MQGGHTATPLSIVRDGASVVTCLHFPDLLHDLFEIVACRVLKRREVDVGLEMLQPQLLADGQDVPVIDIGRGR